MLRDILLWIDIMNRIIVYYVYSYKEKLTLEGY